MAEIDTLKRIAADLAGIYELTKANAAATAAVAALQKQQGLDTSEVDAALADLEAKMAGTSAPAPVGTDATSAASAASTT